MRNVPLGLDHYGQIAMVGVLPDLYMPGLHWAIFAGLN